MLSAIPFKPWDFLTYGLIALGIPLLIRIVQKPDPWKTLRGKWASGVKNERGRIRTVLRLNQDGNAEIDMKGTVAGSDKRLRTSARWQVLDDRSLHLLGTQSANLENREVKQLEHHHDSVGRIQFSGSLD
jgi:hypothetical protein